MKQLLLATAAIVGMSSAALAAEPVALTDSQLDNVTAGQNVTNTVLPVAFQNGGAGIGATAGLAAAGIAPTPVISAAPTSLAANLVTSTITP